jgi:hypothetical protein
MNPRSVTADRGSFAGNSQPHGGGLSLGGATGYAINPARDLGPHLAPAFLPTPGKRN